LTVTVPFTTSAGAGGFAAGGGVSTWAGGCVATGLGFGGCDATVLGDGCGDVFDAAGGGVVFTAEFETTGAVTGRGCSTG
jgi:hypothetical protein